MTTFEDFRAELSTALNHLYDPDYAPARALCEALGCDPAAGPARLQSAVARAIGDLEPPADEPAGSRIRRDFYVLHRRFILKLTQEETAEQLNVSLRGLQRTQRQATHALARRLWESRGQAPRADRGLGRREVAQSEQPPAEPSPMLGWQAQMAQELASLTKAAPHSVTDVAEALREALDLTRLLTESRGIPVDVAYLQPDLTAAVHPSALRQMLIAGIGQMARHLSSGQITLYGRLKDGNVQITITGLRTGQPVGSADDLVRGVPVPEGSVVEADVEGDRASLWLSVPAEGRVTVLVVDDNPDVFYFYRRCTTGTRYHMVHASAGQEALDHLQASRPDLIVLDVMLPDIDGWKLLRRLREDPSMDTVQIIVSSVIRESELALALGAVRHLSKPVQPRHFVEALDEACRQRVAGSPT
jgi:CheY-like chemotaxis protein